MLQYVRLLRVAGVCEQQACTAAADTNADPPIYLKP